MEGKFIRDWEAGKIQLLNDKEANPLRGSFAKDPSGRHWIVRVPGTDWGLAPSYDARHAVVPRGDGVERDLIIAGYAADPEARETLFQILPARIIHSKDSLARSRRP